MCGEAQFLSPFFGIHCHSLLSHFNCVFYHWHNVITKIREEGCYGELNVLIGHMLQQALGVYLWYQLRLSYARFIHEYHTECGVMNSMGGSHSAQSWASWIVVSYKRRVLNIRGLGGSTSFTSGQVHHKFDIVDLCHR